MGRYAQIPVSCCGAGLLLHFFINIDITAHSVIYYASTTPLKKETGWLLFFQNYAVEKNNSVITHVTNVCICDKSPDVFWLMFIMA